MKKSFLYSLLAIMAIAGCQINVVEPDMVTNDSKEFTAAIDEEFNSGTKTSLDAEGNVLWKKYDQVSIFAGSTVNEHYQVTDSSDGKTAATLNKIPDGGFVAGTDIDHNVAFYPYASTVTIAKRGGSYVISDIELPATQSYADGSFGNGAFPMAAVTSSTEDMYLKFKNILGGLKLQLKGIATISSIIVTGNNNEILCGDAEVTVASGIAPSIKLTDASAKTVTLDCGAGVALNTETATSFIIALPPITMPEGFTVLVTDTEGKQMEIKSTKFQTITRSSLLKMPVVEYVGVEIPSDNATKPFTITSNGSTSVSIKKEGSPADIALEYRINEGNWTSYTIGSSVSLSDGESLQFRADEDGNDSFSQDWENYYYFEATGSGIIEVSGNIMSLLDRSLGRVSVPELAFCKLFIDCTKLVEAAELNLPATTLALDCYGAMFMGCTGLTSAPELPATTLAHHCYGFMFCGCTGLITAPELPATTLAYGCYGDMFGGCTGLTSAPELPATTLAESCYLNMFVDCTGLTSAPELPAATLANVCYCQMFMGCTGLISAPELPATTLAESCYVNMFMGCTGLTSAPELPATILAGGCYSNMFGGCTGLTSAPELPATTLADVCYNNMFGGCTGLTTAPELPATTLAQDCYGNMFSGCTGLTTAPELPATTLANNCYNNMFSGCTGLTTVSGLPATTLANSCYYGMFSGCTGLTTVPELPATTLASGCYYGMFSGCTGLTIAPELPATTLADGCYNGMFSGCTGLTTAPELPATTLAGGCYNGMFSSCTGLTSAPELPATTLADRCYKNMFEGCTGLTTVPGLPATTLAISCYYGMFSGCTGLTTVPELPATTLVSSCYKNMFEGCTNLNYIKALFTTKPSSDYTNNWVSGVASTGTFVKSSSATWDVTGSSGIPSGWTVETE